MQRLDGKGFGRLADSLASDWRLRARPEQLPPPGNWTHWLLLAGRGFGKTRTGAEWVREQARNGSARIALVGATASDVRDVMIEGESGILACSPKHDFPDYEPSKRRVSWRNGALATAYSADEADRLRGPQHSAAWADEAAAWRYPDAWTQLMLGLRLGRNPRTIVTTTPRPVKLIRDLLAREGLDVVVTRGRTRDNEANLAPAFINTIIAQYQGTRIGRQELDGEVLEDVPGALWRREWIDRDRVEVGRVPDFRRIVVAIDPAVTSGENADETGIIVAGVDDKGAGYVLEDASGRYGPHEWAARAIAAYHRWGADRIVAETNNGGEMVENTIRMVDKNASFRAVHASRGKVTRAEPISAIYEQRRAHHVGDFPELEDQMCAFTSDFDRARAGYSPDRVDALVWALSELMLANVAKPLTITPLAAIAGGFDFSGIGRTGRLSADSWDNTGRYLS
jgi:phage terminase large subunit-like protein